MQDISKSVGKGAYNIKADVRTVQQLLNGVPAQQGGPAAKLAEDGLMGPKTQTAITNFQVAQLGWGDGRVDPGKQTIQKLNNPGPVVPLGGRKPQTTAPFGRLPGPNVINPVPVEIVAYLSNVAGNVSIGRQMSAYGSTEQVYIKGTEGLAIQEGDLVATHMGGSATIFFYSGAREDLAELQNYLVSTHGPQGI